MLPKPVRRRAPMARLRGAAMPGARSLFAHRSEGVVRLQSSRNEGFRRKQTYSPCASCMGSSSSGGSTWRIWPEDVMT
jgi:hypothetical protein